MLSPENHRTFERRSDFVKERESCFCQVTKRPFRHSLANDTGKTKSCKKYSHSPQPSPSQASSLLHLPKLDCSTASKNEVRAAQTHAQHQHHLAVHQSHQLAALQNPFTVPQLRHAALQNQHAANQNHAVLRSQVPRSADCHVWDCSRKCSTSVVALAAQNQAVHQLLHAVHQQPHLAVPQQSQQHLLVVVAAKSTDSRFLHIANNDCP